LYLSPPSFRPYGKPSISFVCQPGTVPFHFPSIGTFFFRNPVPLPTEAALPSWRSRLLFLAGPTPVRITIASSGFLPLILPVGLSGDLLGRFCAMDFFIQAIFPCETVTTRHSALSPSKGRCVCCFGPKRLSVNLFFPDRPSSASCNRRFELPVPGLFFLASMPFCPLSRAVLLTFGYFDIMCHPSTAVFLSFAFVPSFLSDWILFFLWFGLKTFLILRFFGILVILISTAFFVVLLFPPFAWYGLPQRKVILIFFIPPRVLSGSFLRSFFFQLLGIFSWL